MENNQNKIDELARTIQEVANRLGWNTDVEKLTTRVKQLNQGLVSEDEFLYLLNWFGRCSLVHKLDQFIIPPSAKNEFTIPDCFTIIEHNGERKSFFIEIKTSKDQKLSWREDYYQGLVNYSKATGIPVLVAWKWNSFGIWTLFELRHFQKNVTNYKIGFEKAHMENLMGVLLGDYMVVPFDEIGLHFKFKKDFLVSKQENEAMWQTIVESVYVTGNEGTEYHQYEPGLWSYFFSMELEQRTSETDNHIVTSFIPSPNTDTFAQQVPIRLAHAFTEGEVNWLQKIKNQEFKANYKSLYSSFEKSIPLIIRNIFHIKPNSDLT